MTDDCRKVVKKVFVGNLRPDETVDAAQEAGLLRNLDHPGIVRFYDSFIDAEFFCIVTEFCDVSLLILVLSFEKVGRYLIIVDTI